MAETATSPASQTQIGTASTSVRIRPRAGTVSPLTCSALDTNLAETSHQLVDIGTFGFESNLTGR